LKREREREPQKCRKEEEEWGVLIRERKHGIKINTARNAEVA
jgi:hypothetical protein